MNSFAHGIRFLIGLGMVAAGSALVVPTGLHLVDLGRRQPEPKNAITGGPESPWAVEQSRYPTSSSPGPIESQPAAFGPRLEYSPPPTPPEPLPPPPSMLGSTGPDLAPGYRPTLQTPPPPLLDAQGAPPLAVGWTTRQPEVWGGPQAPATTMADQPRIYLVRDGDDLTGIATRFYGHPAAAATIWEANRRLLRDPGLLPIGAALVLPPQAVVAAAMRPDNHASIEPASEVRPDLAQPRDPVSRPASWLSGGAVPNGLAPPSP